MAEVPSDPARTAPARASADFTAVARAVTSADAPLSASELLPVVYVEMRRLAAARLRGDRGAASLSPTGLVHEAYMKLVRAAGERTLSHSQVGFLQAACPAVLEPILAEQQEAMVAILAPLDAADTQLACAAWRARAEALIESPPPAEPERILRMGRDDDGTVVGTFVLPAQAGVEFEQAIRTAVTWDGADDTRSHGERSADALFEIAAFYNKNHEVPGTPRNHPHVELSLDVSTLHDVPLATDADGRLVDPIVAETLLCHCAWHQVLRDGDAVLAYGRAHYTAPKALFRAVAARDGGCRFPGCCRPVRYCDAHHIRYWRHGGGTDLDNLVLLCSRHHHLVHQQRLDLKLLHDAQLCVTWPDGRQRVGRARGRPPTARAA